MLLGNLAKTIIVKKDNYITATTTLLAIRNSKLGVYLGKPLFVSEYEFPNIKCYSKYSNLPFL